MKNAILTSEERYRKARQLARAASGVYYVADRRGGPAGPMSLKVLGADLVLRMRLRNLADRVTKRRVPAKEATTSSMYSHVVDGYYICERYQFDVPSRK